MENTEKANSKAIAGLVLGIVSILFIFIFPLIGLVTSIVGIVLSKKALNEIKANNGAGRGMAMGGFVTSIIALVIIAIMFIFVLIVVGSIASMGF